MPRDLSGAYLVQLLGRRYGFRVRRSRGSHMTATLATITGEHSVTVPRHHNLRVGTLGQIVSDVAVFVGLPEDVVRRELFER